MEPEKNLNKYKEVIIDPDTAINLLLRGDDISGSIITNEHTAYNSHAEQVLRHSSQIKQNNEEESITDFYNRKISLWNMPDTYYEIDILSFLIDKCNNDKEIERVAIEYQMYEDRDLIILLRFFIFLVDHMRENNIIWGVGRGSSVASFCLYLIQIHRINSLKYNLEITEFLK